MKNKLIENILATSDFEDDKTLELFKDNADINKQGYITKGNGIDILKWKSPRPLRHYIQNSENDFKDITELAFKTKDERLRIHILTALRGVKYPAASALLMFYDRSIYPIIDIRVWKQLHKAGFVNKNPQGQGFSLNQWEEYLVTIRNIAKEVELTARQVEKRLFDIDKKEQTGNLYKAYKK